VALHTSLRIAKITFGFTLRVAVSFNFTPPLRFNDLIDVRFAVAEVGRTSVRHTISIVGSQGLAATATSRHALRPRPAALTARCLPLAGRTTRA
jgi:acyl-CoA thioesterase FadM